MEHRDEMGGFLRNRLVFYRQALRSYREVGAFSFTSDAVSEAVVAPIRRNGRPLRVLEVGSGTGAITRWIVKRLGDGDRLDLYEINPEFAKVLRAEFGALGAPRVTVNEGDIEKLPSDARYDAIISSLPLMNMDPEKVERIFGLLLSRLEPDGVLSYYDYWAKELRYMVNWGRERERLKRVLDVTKRFLAKHQYKKKVVLRNVPPGLVHYLKK